MPGNHQLVQLVLSAVILPLVVDLHQQTDKGDAQAAERSNLVCRQPAKGSDTAAAINDPLRHRRNRCLCRLIFHARALSQLQA